MASITDFAADRLLRDLTGREAARQAVHDLDNGLLLAGKMLDIIYDLVLHPNDGLDEEAVAAACKSTIAMLGCLGSSVDALDAYTGACCTIPQTPAQRAS